MTDETPQEKALRLMTLTLRDIAGSHDCDYADAGKDRPRPCPCARCTAAATLAMLDEGPNNWRYRGAMGDRVRTMPRERKMIESWRKQVDDRLLGGILSERGMDSASFQCVAMPSVRDWFVATSVVQWLATNVGMEVLRQAGFEYKGWEADSKERAQKELLP